MNVTVALKAKHWKTLVNFVTGDLHNMAEDDLKTELRTILDKIRNECDRATISKKRNHQARLRAME